MTTLNSLVQLNINIGKLEKEVTKARNELVEGHKNKSSGDSDRYMIQLRYVSFLEQLKKENDKFEKLFKELNEVSNGNNNNNNNNNNSNSNNNNNDNVEITDHLEVESESSSPAKAYDESLTNSVPVNDNSVNDNLPFVEDRKEDKNEDRKEESPKVKYMPTSKGREIGYIYRGKGFEVFTNAKNRNKPIYSSTMLYCYETCNKNKRELKSYLVQHGKFNPSMIKEILFKSGFNGDYTLIKVRGPLEYIKKKIKNLNRAINHPDGDTISIFQRTGGRKADPLKYIHINNKLYITNFDIINADSHRKFTNLMLGFGDLAEDVQMGLGRNRDLYAIVHFKNVDDAVKCLDFKGLKFDGKRLSIRFTQY